MLRSTSRPPDAQIFLKTLKKGHLKLKGWKGLHPPCMCLKWESSLKSLALIYKLVCPAFRWPHLSPRADLMFRGGIFKIDNLLKTNGKFVFPSWTYVFVRQNQSKDVLSLPIALQKQTELASSTTESMAELVNTKTVHTGRLMWNLVGIRRKMAESRSWGRLVAPIMITWHGENYKTTSTCLCVQL